MYTYWQIFKQAFRISWQKPSLWFFGFFAFFLGSTAEIELLLGGSSFGSPGFLLSFWQGLAAGGLFTPEGMRGLSQALIANPITLFIIILVSLFVIGIGLLLVWLVIISQSALISQAVGVSKNKELSWRQSFSLGLYKFWPVLGLNLSMRAIVWLLFLITGFLASLKFPGSISLFILSFDLFLVLVLLISFITKYAICGVVLKNQEYKGAIRSAWKIFTNNWLISLEISIILFFK